MGKCIITALILCSVCMLYIKYKNPSITYAKILQRDENMIELNDDITLCDKNHDICDINPKDIGFGVHHKSGTHLFRSFVEEIEQFYNYKCNRTTDKFHITEQETTHFKFFYSLHPTWAQANHYSNNYGNKTDYPRIKILFHAIREPVNMILSGYNYHKSVSEEIPTHISSINDLVKKDIINKDKSKRIFRTKRYYECYSKLFYDNDQNNILYETYKFKDNPIYYNKTIQYLLQNVFIVSDGLLWEYERFICLEGSQI